MKVIVDSFKEGVENHITNACVYTFKFFIVIIVLIQSVYHKKHTIFLENSEDTQYRYYLLNIV